MNPIDIWKNGAMGIKSFNENCTTMTNIFFHIREHADIPRVTARKTVILYETHKINPDHRKSPITLPLIWPIKTLCYLFLTAFLPFGRKI
jgi:hypothetical protein